MRKGGEVDREESKREMKSRTKEFALRVIRLVQALPRGQMADVLGKQLLRSGTFVGANYRAACRAKSRADFISKMGIVEEEADESMYWMELLIESRLVRHDHVANLLDEADQLVAMTVSSIQTARSNKS